MKAKIIFIKCLFTKCLSLCAAFTIFLGFVSAISVQKTFADTAPNDTSETTNSETEKTPVSEPIIYVNPTTGTDSSSGSSEASAYQTISFAIEQATPGTIIQLAPGQYNTEPFPLVVKSGITLRGNENSQGKGVEIIGGGLYNSQVFARQDITILTQGNAKISGLTVTNNNSRGTGIWIESGQPIIQNNTFTSNKREGVFVTGKAIPNIENNRFIRNDANGISITKQAGGEILNNIFESTGFGIVIGGNSTPTVSNNKIYSNRNGIVLTDFAKPQILSNNIENNTDYGVVIIGQAKPNMDKNTFARNRKKDMFQAVPYSQK